MEILSALTQLILAAVLVINALLAFLVYHTNKKSATNIIFIFLALIISVWLVIIYKASTPSTSAIVLLYTRFAVFFAVPLSVSFFLLAHTIPSESLLLKKHNLYLIIISTIIIMVLTLSPLVFKKVIVNGENIQSVPGMGMPVFAIFTTFFSVAAIYTFIKKVKKSTGEVKEQISFMMKVILMQDR